MRQSPVGKKESNKPALVKETEDEKSLKTDTQSALGAALFPLLTLGSRHMPLDDRTESVVRPVHLVWLLG